MQGQRENGLKQYQRNEELRRNQTQSIPICDNYYHHQKPDQPILFSACSIQIQLGLAADPTTAQNNA